MCVCVGGGGTVVYVAYVCGGSACVCWRYTVGEG